MLHVTGKTKYARIRNIDQVKTWGDCRTLLVQYIRYVEWLQKQR
jgi:hypothetical protein